jgi:hypothetical protein
MLLLISRLFLFPGPGLAESAAIDFPSPRANISFTHGSILHKTGLILCPEARSSKTKAAAKHVAQVSCASCHSWLGFFPLSESQISPFPGKAKSSKL